MNTVDIIIQYASFPGLNTQNAAILITLGTITAVLILGIIFVQEIVGKFIIAGFALASITFFGTYLHNIPQKKLVAQQTWAKTFNDVLQDKAQVISAEKQDNKVWITIQKNQETVLGVPLTMEKRQAAFSPEGVEKLNDLYIQAKGQALQINSNPTIVKNNE